MSVPYRHFCHGLRGVELRVLGRSVLSRMPDMGGVLGDTSDRGLTSPYPSP
jgi:hypothetical protein